MRDTAIALNNIYMYRMMYVVCIVCLERIIKRLRRDRIERKQLSCKEASVNSAKERSEGAREKEVRQEVVKFGWTSVFR